MTTPTIPELLAGVALVILGILGGLMMFYPIPSANATSFTFVLGALAGALTVAGGQKAAQIMSGDHPTVNAPLAPAETT